ncbi:MAG: hypothetical protein AAF846_16245 [Chloroflexota bacterium]
MTVPRQKLLQETLDFTDSDLKANRSGKLSQYQKDWLRELERPKLSWLSIGAIVGIIALVLPLLINNLFDAGIVIVMIGFIPFMLLLGLSAIKWLEEMILFSLDISRGEVESDTGIIWLSDKSHNKQDDEYYLHIGVDGDLLHIDRATYDILQNKMALTVYYTPRTKIIVAVERLDADTSKLILKDELKYLDYAEAQLKVKHK